MAKKKDASFLQAKAQILKDFGIESEVIKELVPVDITFNQNHARAYAEGRGQSLDEFIQEVNDKAQGDVKSTPTLLSKEEEPAERHEFQKEQDKKRETSKSDKK